MKRMVVLVVVLLCAVSLLWAGGKKEEKEPEKEKEKTTSEEMKDSKYGGIMTRAYFAPSTLDPAFANDITGGEICGIWGDYLAYVDEDLSIDQNRSLAENWDISNDGRTYTFTLRKGVKFHNGEEMTSKDVKVTFDRLRDTEIGAVTANLYSNIESIETAGTYTVVFILKQRNPDFLFQLGEYQAIITWSGTEDFNKQQIGTGKFMIDSYMPEDRITFKRNPDYWRKDAEGNQLPYLDGIDYLFLPEPSSQVEALRGGQVDYLIYVPTEYISSLEADANIEVYKKPSNFHYAIRMRSDKAPFDDVRVRQAFRAAVDRSAILLGSFEGLGVTGRDTPFGPGYGDYYLDVPEPKRDIEKAKRLLAEAGYENAKHL